MNLDNQNEEKKVDIVPLPENKGENEGSKKIKTKKVLSEKQRAHLERARAIRDEKTKSKYDTIKKTRKAVKEGKKVLRQKIKEMVEEQPELLDTPNELIQNVFNPTSVDAEVPTPANTNEFLDNNKAYMDQALNNKTELDKTLEDVQPMIVDLLEERQPFVHAIQNYAEQPYTMDGYVYL